MNVTADSDWAPNRLYIDFILKNFFSLDTKDKLDEIHVDAPL